MILCSLLDLRVKYSFEMTAVMIRLKQTQCGLHKRKYPLEYFSLFLELSLIFQINTTFSAFGPSPWADGEANTGSPQLTTVHLVTDQVKTALKKKLTYDHFPMSTVQLVM